MWVPIFILREEALCGEGRPESRGGLQGEPSPSESEQGLGEATGNLSDQNKSKNISSSVKGVSGAPLSLSPPPPPFFPFLVPTAVEGKKKEKISIFLFLLIKEMTFTPNSLYVTTVA